jgi:hypothetical protein
MLLQVGQHDETLANFIVVLWSGFDVYIFGFNYYLQFFKSLLSIRSGLDIKQYLQRLIFPEGIVYNKEIDIVRTTRVNSFFEPIPQLVSFLNENKKSHPFIR